MIKLLWAKGASVACLLAVLCAACASSTRDQRESFAAVTSGQVRSEGAVELTGWAHVRGEIMLYATRGAMRQRLRFPYCVSGVFRDQDVRSYSEFDGSRVTVVGTLHDYTRLPLETDRPILRRPVIAGVVIPNVCYGNTVLLLDSITLAD